MRIWGKNFPSRRKSWCQGLGRGREGVHLKIEDEWVSKGK